jgi:hypothetical protein
MSVGLWLRRHGVSSGGAETAAAGEDFKRTDRIKFEKAQVERTRTECFSISLLAKLSKGQEWQVGPEWKGTTSLSP